MTDPTGRALPVLVPGVGIVPPEPHYPSSAELAAFRRSLYWMASGPSDNANAAGWHGPMIHPAAGAWQGERRDGIGYGDHDPNTWGIRTMPGMEGGRERYATASGT